MMRMILGHWMLAKSRRHFLASLTWKARAEKVFAQIKGLTQKNGDVS